MTDPSCNPFNRAVALRLRRCAFIFAGMALSGCATSQEKWQTSQGSAQEFITTPATTAATASASAPVPQAASANQQASLPAQNGVVYAGTPPSAQTHVDRGSVKRKPSGGISLNFVNTPIRDVAQIILGDHLNKEFVVADDVTGSVSLNANNGLRSADLLPTLRTLLNSVDARLVDNNGDYRIVPGAEQTVRVNPGGDLEILPLRYIDAAEFTKVLESYQVSATAVTQGNLVAVSGSKNKLREVRELARSFDVNWFQGMSIGVFTVQNTSATLLKKDLLKLFGKDIKNDVAGALRLVAIERSNSILVISPQNSYVRMIGDWITRLDKIDQSGTQGFYVYRVQNGKAKDLAALLQGMFGTTDRNNDDEQNLNNTAVQPAVAPNNFRVIPDDSTNSLIITGSPYYFQLVRSAMAELDSAPLQVLVEARIMELSLSDELNYGLEWFLQGSRASSDTAARLDFGAAGLGLTSPGFSYVIERAGEVRAALNGLADDSRLKVLSSPSLMVLNNQVASILVGDEVPIPTRQAISNISPEAPTVNEIEYRNTGILLTVTPRVNAGGMVTMDISQEVSSVVNNTTSNIDAPTIQQRRLSSTVSIQSGQTVVLGGLIREQTSSRDSGVPILKNIPGLGKLFSTTSNRLQRTELVALITPRVIVSGEQTQAITQEYRQKLLGLKPIPISDL